MKALFLALPLVLLPAAGFAQTAPAACASTNANLSAPWQGWTATAPLTAAAKAADQPDVKPGQAYAVTLQPTTQMQYTIPLGRAPKDGSFGGLFSLTVATAGTYSIALDQGAWIDMVRDQQAVKSSSHGHGPDCSTIHKTVEFQLTPGQYTIQVSAADAPALTLEVAMK